MIKAIIYVISVGFVEGSTKEIGKVLRMEAIKAILPILDLRLHFRLGMQQCEFMFLVG